MENRAAVKGMDRATMGAQYPPGRFTTEMFLFGNPLPPPQIDGELFETPIFSAPPLKHVTSV